jgi:hypothetical protein
MTPTTQANVEYIGLTTPFTCPQCAGKVNTSKFGVITGDRSKFMQSLTQGGLQLNLQCSNGHKILVAPTINFQNCASLKALKDQGFM